MALLSIEEIVLELAQKELGKTYEPVYTTQQEIKEGFWSQVAVVSGYKLVSEVKECVSCHDYSQPCCIVCKGTGEVKVTYRELDND